MKQYFKKKFQVTEQGAKGLVSASITSFFVYIISMFPVMSLMLIGDMFILKNFHSKWVYFGFAAVTLLALFMVLWLEYEKLYNATYKESANLRISIAKRLRELPLSYFSKRNLSDLAQSIMADVDSVEHAMSHSIPKVYALYLFFPLLSVMLLLGNYKLAIAVMIPNILRFVVLIFYKSDAHEGNSKYYDILRTNSEKFQEIIELNNEIRGFNLTDKIKSELFEQMEYSEKEHLKSEKTIVKILSLSAFFSFISLGVVLIVGTKLLLDGETTVLHLLGYLLAAIKIKEVVDITSESTLEVLYIAPRVAKIKEINEQEIQEGEEIELKKFDIELENVSFSYSDDVQVLKDVSFVAKQGEVTALVGASGCGKSTLLKLISRLYDYDSGKIKVDGKDIKDISVDSLFAKTSIVFQDVTLFNTSIMENIRIGRIDASDEEVKEAARLANCMEFIEKLPEGFNSFIGENGAELSGGERQRLSIARAFLKNAPILILDEIASSLDVENETKIQESLNKLIENKTVIVISHRLKSIENVDKIVVIDEGEVENIGKHHELLEKSKVYKNLNKKMKMAEEFAY